MTTYRTVRCNGGLMLHDDTCTRTVDAEPWHWAPSLVLTPLDTRPVNVQVCRFCLPRDLVPVESDVPEEGS